MLDWTNPGRKWDLSGHLAAAAAERVVRDRIFVRSCQGRVRARPPTRCPPPPCPPRAPACPPRAPACEAAPRGRRPRAGPRAPGRAESGGVSRPNGAGRMPGPGRPRLFPSRPRKSRPVITAGSSADFPGPAARPPRAPVFCPLPSGRRPGAGCCPPVRPRTALGRPPQVRPPAAGPGRRRSRAPGNSCVLDGRRPAPPVRPVPPAPRAGPAGAAAGGGNPGRRGREIGRPGISGIALDPFLSPWVTLSEPKVMHRALLRRWLTWPGQGRQRIDNEQGAKPHPH